MSKTPSVAFGVSRHGKRIDRLPTSSAVHTGITYDVQFPGVVPFFEEYDAMVDANYNSDQWSGLQPSDRAEAVARYRLKRYIALHEADALEVHYRSKRNKS